MKNFSRVLCVLLLTAVLLPLFSSCADGGGKAEDLGKSEYALNADRDADKALAALKDRLSAIFGGQRDEEGPVGPPPEPAVEFDGASVLSYGDLKLPTRILYYMLCEMKSTEIGNAGRYGIAAEDSDVFWNSLYPDIGLSRRDYLYQRTRDYCEGFLISFAEGASYGFTESDSYIQSYENILSFYGGQAGIDEYYRAFGLDGELLKTYLRYMCWYNDFREFLVGVGGKLFPAEDEAKGFFYSDFAYIQQIVFTYIEKDSGGRIVYKSEKDIAETRKQGQELYARISEDPKLFERNIFQTQHPEWSDNPNGYLYSRGKNPPDLDKAYFSILPGDITLVDTDIGIYIIKGLEKSDGVFADNISQVYDACCEKRFNDELAKYGKSLVWDKEQFNKYKFSDIILLG